MARASGIAALWLLILTCHTTTSSAYLSCTGDSAACDALGVLWYSTGGASWTTQGGWAAAAAGTPTPLCGGFYGVGCNADGKLTSLALPSNNLRGSLPSDIFASLPALTSLNLSNNLLSGPAPPSLASCTALASVDMSYTLLAGGLLDALAPLPALQVLRLHSSSLRGRVPAFASTSLQVVDMSDNLLLGAAFPPQLCRFVCGWTTAFEAPAAHGCANATGAACGRPFAFQPCGVTSLSAADFAAAPARACQSSTITGACVGCLPSILAVLAAAGANVSGTSNSLSCVNYYVPQLMQAGASFAALAKVARCPAALSYAQYYLRNATCRVALNALQASAIAAGCVNGNTLCTACRATIGDALYAAGVATTRFTGVEHALRSDYDNAMACVVANWRQLTTAGLREDVLYALNACPVPAAPFAVTAAIVIRGVAAADVVLSKVVSAVALITSANLADITAVSAMDTPGGGEGARRRGRRLLATSAHECVVTITVGAVTSAALTVCTAALREASANGDILSALRYEGIAATNASIVLLAPSQLQPGAGESPSSAARVHVVGVVVGVVSGTCVFSGALLAAAVLRRRRRRAQATGDKLEGGDSSVHSVDPLRSSPGSADASSHGGNWSAALTTEAEISMGALLGVGAFATVHEARWRGTAVAVKCFDPRARIHRSSVNLAAFDADSRTGVPAWMSNRGELEPAFVREMAFLSKLRHPNIVAVYAVILRPPMLVVELAPAGSLSALLRRRSLADLSWAQRADILLGVACGVEFLHAQSPVIIHRDLKARSSSTVV